MNHVFISYRHVDDAHAAAVRLLAESLKDEGLPVVLDQMYVEGEPGGPDNGGWSRWCIDNAEQAACVLIVCSAGWFEAAIGEGPQMNGRGVAAEAFVFQNELYRKRAHNERIRFVVLDGFNQEEIPLRFAAWHVFQPNADAHSNDQMRLWIRKRLAMSSSAGSQAGKVVYLGECRYDRRVERENLRDFLQTAGWLVLPDVKPGRPFDEQLGKSFAFLQLVESYARDDGSHRTQLTAARAAKLPCYRFRHANTRLDEAEATDAAHYQFLTEPDITTGSFDDFKGDLLKDLEGKLNRKHAPQPYATKEMLVRVAIRASDPDTIWDQVFAWVDAEVGIRPALLADTESFKDKHDPKVPCHGFLIVCDRMVEEGTVSAKTDLEHCMQIQLGERNVARRPPVGVVFWPPPATPRWSRLLRVVPPKVSKIVVDQPGVPPGDAPGDLQGFFQEVRRCYQ